MGRPLLLRAASLSALWFYAKATFASALTMSGKR